MCERQPDNEHDRNAVAVFHDNLVNRRVVGHVPLNYSAVFSQFLLLPRHHIRCRVTGVRINRGLACGLEVHVDYIFIGDTKAISWISGRLSTIEKALDARVHKCMK